MPRGDGTGPMGMGRMTGRGAGYCLGAAAPGYATTVGTGCGFGGGHGFRRMFYATGMPGRSRTGYSAYTGTNEATAEEKQILNNQAEYLESQLQQVKKQLSRLTKDAE